MESIQSHLLSFVDRRNCNVRIFIILATLIISMTYSTHWKKQFCSSLYNRPCITTLSIKGAISPRWQNWSWIKSLTILIKLEKFLLNLLQSSLSSWTSIASWWWWLPIRQLLWHLSTAKIVTSTVILKSDLNNHPVSVYWVQASWMLWMYPLWRWFWIDTQCTFPYTSTLSTLYKHAHCNKLRC